MSIRDFLIRFFKKSTKSECIEDIIQYSKDELKIFIENYNRDFLKIIDYIEINNDKNGNFRNLVIDEILSGRVNCPILLISDLFEIEARYTEEAWASGPYLTKLATLMLNRGGEEELKCFIKNFNRSNDTLLSLHAEMRLKDSKRDIHIKNILKYIEQSNDSDEIWILEDAISIISMGLETGKTELLSKKLEEIYKIKNYNYETRCFNN